MADHPQRFLIVADGPPTSQLTNSGVARGISAALERSDAAHVVATRSTRVTGPWRVLVSALTFRPSRAWWWFNFNFGLISVSTRSFIRERVARRLWERGEIDFVLHVRNIYRPSRVPYIAFIDSTSDMANRGWTAWQARTGFGRRVQRRVEQRYYQRALRIFTAGEAAATNLTSTYKIDPARVATVGGGINFDHVPDEAADARQSKHVLWVGLDFERKGGDLLVTAFRALRKRHPDARLTLVGADPGINENGIRSLGRISDRHQLSELYASATVFCLPARHEPYGLVVQEAMAHGLPCVVSATGELPRIVGHDQTGRVLDELTSASIEAALRSLLEDEQTRHRLGTAARQRAWDSLTWDAVAARMLNSLSTLDRRNP